MSFSIDYDKQPTKVLRKSDKHISSRIVTKIREKLENNPVPSDAKTIVNAKDVFRIRIGDYRAIYRINYEKQLMIIIKIDKRERVYD